MCGARPNNFAIGADYVWDRPVGKNMNQSRGPGVPWTGYDIETIDNICGDEEKRLFSIGQTGHARCAM